MNKSRIFTTLINPPLVFGVTAGFLFLVLILLFSTIPTAFVFGFLGFLVHFLIIFAFYLYGKNRSKEDPYWLNMFIMAALFEKRRPLQFLKRLFTKEDKIFRR